MTPEVASFVSNWHQQVNESERLSAPGFVMPRNTVYWFVATSQMPSAVGHFAWATTSQQVPGNPWIGGGFQVSSNGVNWTRGFEQEFQFAVNAHLIPEPSAGTLLALGSVIFVALGRAHSQTRSVSKKTAV